MGFIDVGLLDENCYNINLIAGETLLLNKCFALILRNTSYTTSLSGYISDWPLSLVKVGALLKAF